MNTITEAHVPLPWYRQPLVWMLILGPATVVVAGFYTLYLAVSTDSGLVDDDYYEHGLAINRVLDRDHAAQRYGVQARAMLAPAGGAINVQLSAAQSTLAMPERIECKLSHATRAGLDQKLTLVRMPGGDYQGTLPALAPGHWYLQLAAADWRLTGDLHIPGDSVVELAPMQK